MSTAGGDNFRFVVHGLPAPQGSKQPYGRGRVESSARVKPWREAVKSSVLEVVGDKWEPWDCPIWLHVTFFFLRPKSHYRTGRNAHLLRDAAPVWPAVYPDASKLARSTEDALTDAGFWRDDSRVVDLRVRKEYAHPRYGMSSPGAYIYVQKATGSNAH